MRGGGLAAHLAGLAEGEHDLVGGLGRRDRVGEAVVGAAVVGGVVASGGSALLSVQPWAYVAAG